MADEVLAALQAAAPESVTETEDEGQTQESQPAPTEAEKAAVEAQKTEAAKRRERREANEQRTRDELAAKDRTLVETQARLDRIQKASTAQAEPKETDFADVGEYWAAKGAWRAINQSAQTRIDEAKAEADQAKTEVERIRTQQKQARFETFEAEAQDARARYADFDAARAVAARADVISPALAEIVLESAQPADLVYHLGTHPEIGQRLSLMPPQAAAFELGRIAAGLAMPQPKLASSAPAPINPVRPSGTASKNPETMSAKEFDEWRRAGGQPTR